MIDPAVRRAVADARQAVLVTIARTGLPRPVPICLSVAAADATGPLILHSPIDEKPKSSEDPMRLARVRDVVARPDVSVLVEHWDEDWSRLWWVRLSGRASMVLAEDATAASERAAAIAALRAKYPQYERQSLDRRPLIRIEVLDVTSWGNLPEA